MISDPRTRNLSETAAARGPKRPLHTKGGGQNYLENSLAAAAEPFKGITADGNLISGLSQSRKLAWRPNRSEKQPRNSWVR